MEELLERVRRNFAHRHANLDATFDNNYEEIAALVRTAESHPSNARLLIGSYLTMEYSIASAALFNPSIVQHRNQWNLPDGAVRFILSFRATGEGHVSCVVFRTGVITSDHDVQMDPPARFAPRRALRPTGATTNRCSIASCRTSA